MGRRKRNSKYSSYHFIDMTGTRIHRWLVLHVDGKDPAGQYKWLCQCDCGNIRSVRGGDLRCGGSMSCGCWAVKCISKHVHKDDDYPQRRGLSKLPEYRIWRGLVQRNGLYKMRPNYTVCKEWMDDSEAFIKQIKDLGWKKGDEIVLKDEATEYGPDTIYIAPRGTTTSILKAAANPDLRGLEGKKFGHLTVINSFSHNGKWASLCRCDCGNQSTVDNCAIVRGSVKTCGCLFGGKWSINHAHCLHCKRTDRPHHSRGICTGCRCYLKNHGLLESYKPTKKPYKNHVKV